MAQINFYLQPYELPICRFPDTAYGGSIQYKSKQKITNPITKEVTEVMTQLIIFDVMIIF